MFNKPNLFHKTAEMPAARSPVLLVARSAHGQ